MTEFESVGELVTIALCALAALAMGCLMAYGVWRACWFLLSGH